MAFQTYNTYMFKVKDKDPIISIIWQAMKDDQIDWKDLPEFTGVKYQTYYNWFYGATRRPCWTLVIATVRALPTSTQRMIFQRLVNVNAPTARQLRLVVGNG